MLTFGFFGQSYYNEPPIKHPISVLDRETFHWHETNQRPSAEEIHQDKSYAALVIGGAKLEGVALVYFMDEEFPHKAFAMSYKKLTTLNTGMPPYRFKDIPDQLNRYFQEAQVFGYQPLIGQSPTFYFDLYKGSDTKPSK